MHVDILKGPSKFSLCLQNVDDIVFANSEANAIKSLISQGPMLWPTVKLVLEKVVSEGSINSYQGVELILLPWKTAGSKH